MPGSLWREILNAQTLLGVDTSCNRFRSGAPAQRLKPQPLQDAPPCVRAAPDDRYHICERLMTVYRTITPHMRFEPIRDAPGARTTESQEMTPSLEWRFNRQDQSAAGAEAFSIAVPGAGGGL